MVEYVETLKTSRMWDLFVSVPDHCLSFYFNYEMDRVKRIWYL